MMHKATCNLITSRSTIRVDESKLFKDVKRYGRHEDVARGLVFGR